MGLWCVEHQAYIKFLSKRDQKILRHTDIVWLATEPSWVRKKSSENPVQKLLTARLMVNKL